jgi:hypothetical protein
MPGRGRKGGLTRGQKRLFALLTTYRDVGPRALVKIADVKLQQRVELADALMKEGTAEQIRLRPLSRFDSQR